MSIELNPSALGLHFVPVGATIPPEVAYLWYSTTGWQITSNMGEVVQFPMDCSRWTAEPIPAPEAEPESLATRARVLAEATQAVYADDIGDILDKLAAIVSELAEKVEAKP